MAQNILIIDDEPVQRRLLDASVRRMGLNSLLAESGEEALDILAAGSAPVAVVVLDLVMPGMDGIAALTAMRERGHQMPVIVQTAQGGIETVVRAMRAGAFDFVVKPVSPERLQTAIGQALRMGAVDSRKREKRREGAPGGFSNFICASPRMKSVLAMAAKAARSNIPVLVEGESGVGKEVVARAIQGASDRSGKPFVTVNCGALPENLVESILFGHEKGAFTGAMDKHVGKFEEANGGTLFLDEIGELPLDMQVKLLRAIQEGEIDPVGARKPVKVNVRLVSATNRDLMKEVAAGRFREDLFYRLNVLPLTVPPLRDRREDIAPLAIHFASHFASEQGRADVEGITPRALAMLGAYDWPGNIRQLENAIFRAVVLSEGGQLTEADFPQIAAQIEGFVLPDPGSEPGPPLAPEPFVAETTFVAPADPVMSGPVPAAPAAGMLSLVGEDGEVRPMEQVEAETLRCAIDYYGGRMSEVARRLGIGRSTLYRKLRDLGLDAGETEDEKSG